MLIRVAYSSLNYKDALGDARRIRALCVRCRMCRASIVPAPWWKARRPTINPGDEVLVTGYEFGAGHGAASRQFVRVPAEWVVPLPSGLSVRDAMIYGTAGFTAAQCVTAIVDRGIGPERGPVVVTGATGGVGSLAVAILAKIGYEVEAVTGKPDQHDWLRRTRREHDSRSRRRARRHRSAAALRSLGRGGRYSGRQAAGHDPAFDRNIAAASPLAAWWPAPSCTPPCTRSSSAA